MTVAVAVATPVPPHHRVPPPPPPRILAQTAAAPPSNALIKYVNELLARYCPGKCIKNAHLYERALTHRSAAAGRHNPRTAGVRSNERLEYLGDAVLYLAVAAYLHQRYPDEDEGFLTRVRTKLVKGSTLADLCARGTRLGELLRLRNSRCHGAHCATGATAHVKGKAANAHVSAAALEDVLEAFLGAVFEDHGFDVARAWLVGFLEDNVDFAQLVAHQDNPKDVLNRHYRATYGCVPAYEEVGTSAADGQLWVRVRGRDGGVIATGAGTDRKKADEAAARAALDYLHVTAPR